MKKTLVLAFLSLLLGATSAVPLVAATLDWTALPDGDFAVTTNWSSPPAAGDTLLIENGGTAWLNSEYSPTTAVDIGDLGVGNALGNGTLTIMDGGSLVTGATGTYNGLFLGGPTYTGTVNVNGGSIITAPADGVGAVGVIYVGISGANLAQAAYGFYNQTAGSTTCGNLMLGMHGTESVGTANISGGTLTAPGTSGVYVCGYTTGRGMFYQSGGTVSAGILAVGYRVGYGYYKLSGDGLLKQVGAPSATRNFYVGKYGYGILEQTGGTVTAASRLIVSGDLSTVLSESAYGVYNLSGGTATVCTGGTSSGYYSAIGAGAYGNGVLNLSGTGSLEVKGGTTYGRLYVGYATSDASLSPTSGVVNLGAVASTEDPDGGGGTLAVNWLEKSDYASVSGTVNFHGGTLKARNSSSDFLKNTTNYVYGEGAAIDTNEKNVTIATALAAPTGKGITGITLGSAGSNYTAPPVVIISGDGTRATATAKVNETGGLDIVMTNLGTGYSDPSTVTVTLYGGDGTGAGLGLGGTVTLADNVSGGLTKKGLGTLTLSATNTYTGATTVEAGTLAVTGSITSNVTVADGGTLGGAEALLGGVGTVTGDVTVATGGSVAPGASAGRLNIAGDLDMAAGAGMTWELASLVDQTTGVAGTDFDQILLKSGDLDLGTAAKLTLDFGLLATADQPTADPLNAFWEGTHSWKIIDVDADNGGTNSGATDFATIAFSGTTPSHVVFDTLLGTTAGVDLGDVYLTCAPGTPPSIPGDANGDGYVNAADAQSLATNWGVASGATWAMGDFNKDGAVNAADASILAANWGYGVTEGTAVPEPGTLALLLAGLALVGLRRRDV